MYLDSTYVLVLIGLLLGLWAQSSVRSAYRSASQVMTRQGRPASEVVMELLHRNGNDTVVLGRVGGEMTDHYNPATGTLNLSDGVYDSASAAALGIAAHEAGHAMQKLTGYSPLSLRTAIVPVVNIGSQAAIPIFLLGMVLSFRPLAMIGIVLFGLTFFFALITLPVEFDASRRALRMLTEGGYVTAEEENSVRRVLRAAAMTYVASAIASLLNLIRLILISGGSNRRRR